MHDLSNRVVTKRLPLTGTSTYVGAAGTTTLTTASVDRTGYAGVRFIIDFGAIVSGAVTSVKVAQSSDNSTFSDVAGSAVTVADTDDNKQVIIDVVRPAYKYLQAVIVRGTQNATVDSMTAELYNPDNRAVTQDTTVVSANILVSPANGTA